MFPEYTRESISILVFFIFSTLAHILLWAKCIFENSLW
jgi:hypothetical protein